MGGVRASPLSRHSVKVVDIARHKVDKRPIASAVYIGGGEHRLTLEGKRQQPSLTSPMRVLLAANMPLVSIFRPGDSGRL